jgi:phage-related protein
MDRGKSMQAQMQCAFMAQNKDDAIQQHRDMRMVMASKQIKSTERLIELKIKMSDRMGGGGSEAIETVMDKLENLSANLDSMMSEVRVTNPIVRNVLANATKAMGLESDAKVQGMPKRDEDNKDDG